MTTQTLAPASGLLLRVLPPGMYAGRARMIVERSLMVNRRAWDALPETHRAALEAACAEASAEQTARYDHNNPLALRRLVAGGAQLRFWPREVMQAAWRETHGLYEELSGRNERSATRSFAKARMPSL